jgi:hypothetical protein
MKPEHARHVLECAEDVGDMGQRVMTNGAEPNYASEKLAFAAERAIVALTIIGAPREAIARLVNRAEEHGAWLAGRRT